MASSDGHDWSGDEMIEYLKTFKCQQEDVLSDDEKLSYLVSVLQKLAEALSAKQLENRVVLPGACLGTLCSVLSGCVTHGQEGREPALLSRELCRTVCSWCLRCLRNACVQAPSTQRTLWDSGVIGSLQSLICLVATVPEPRPEELSVCLRCAVQLLGNLVSGQSDLPALMWMDICPQTLLSVLSIGDSRASQYLCMVVSICLQSSPIEVDASRLWTGDAGHQLVEAMLELCQTEAEQDFSLQLLQTLVSLPEFVPSVWDHLKPSSKLLLLDLLAAFLSQDGSGDDDEDAAASAPSGPLPRHQSSPLGPAGQPATEHLARVFEEEAGSVFGLVSDEEWGSIEEQKKPQLVLRLLGILCTVTGDVQGACVLQQRSSLLECSLGLLDRAHSLGKRGTNHFTSTQRLEGARAQANPVFGFKRDLVRLIGNMCHGHTANQDKVRDLLGIPVLLEQCNIDDSNPFISQWAIFALHNLCEGNLKNQAVIAEMTNQGVVNNDQLQQYGFQADYRDGQMYYKPTRKK